MSVVRSCLDLTCQAYDVSLRFGETLRGMRDAFMF